MAGELLRMAPDETCHPLLHAVHYLQPDVVEFLCESGLSPCQRGTVHPYTGDGLVVGELQGVTPLQLIDTMLWHIAAEGRRRSKKKMKALKIQDILKKSAERQQQREDFLRGISTSTSDESNATNYWRSSGEENSMMTSSGPPVETQQSSSQRGEYVTKQASAKIEPNTQEHSEMFGISPYNNDLPPESSSKHEQTLEKTLPKLEVKAQSPIRTAEQLLQHATFGGEGRLPPPSRPLIVVGLNLSEIAEGCRPGKDSCVLLGQGVKWWATDAQGSNGCSIPAVDILLHQRVSKLLSISPKTWIQSFWQSFAELACAKFDISDFQYRLCSIAVENLDKSSEDSSKDKSWKEGVEWLRNQAQSTPWSNLVSVQCVKQLSITMSKDGKDPDYNDSHEQLSSWLRGPDAWMPLRNDEVHMSEDEQASAVTGKLIPENIRQQLKENGGYSEGIDAPKQVGEWPFRLLILIQETVPSDGSGGIAVVVQDTESVQRWQIQSAQELVKDPAFGLCVAGNRLYDPSRVGIKRNSSDTDNVVKHLSFQEDTGTKETYCRIATPVVRPSVNCSIVHPAVSVCSLLERFMSSCGGTASEQDAGVWALNIPDTVRAMPKEDAIQRHSLYSWPCISDRVASLPSVVRVGTPQALIRWLELSSVFRTSTQACNNGTQNALDNVNQVFVEKTLSLIRRSFRMDSGTSDQYQRNSHEILKLLNTSCKRFVCWIPGAVPVPTICTRESEDVGDNEGERKVRWQWRWVVSHAEDAEASDKTRQRPSLRTTEITSGEEHAAQSLPILSAPGCLLERAAINVGQQMRESFMFLVHCIRAMAGATTVNTTVCPVLVVCRLAQPLYNPNKKYLNEEERSRVYAWCSGLYSAISNACVRDANGTPFGANLTSLSATIPGFVARKETDSDILMSDYVWLSGATPCQYALVAVELRSIKFGAASDEKLLPVKKRRV